MNPLSESEAAALIEQLRAERDEARAVVIENLKREANTRSSLKVAATRIASLTARVEEQDRLIGDEREACAKICDEWLRQYGKAGAELRHTTPQQWANDAVADIAELIRARATRSAGKAE